MFVFLPTCPIKDLTFVLLVQRFGEMTSYRLTGACQENGLLPMLISEWGSGRP